jgi:hypothetical protein
MNNDINVFGSFQPLGIKIVCYWLRHFLSRGIKKITTAAIISAIEISHIHAERMNMLANSITTTNHIKMAATVLKCIFLTLFIGSNRLF